jgi:hypothetical protein
MTKFAAALLLMLISLSSFSQTITWETPITVYSGSGSNLHPRIALNRNGDPYVLWGKADTKAYFSKWDGTSFTAPVVPSDTLTVFALSWAGPDMAAYGDTVYVAMKALPEMANTSYCYLAHSYDGGSTFSPPVRVDNIDTHLSSFPIVTTTANGNPLVAFMKYNASMGDSHYMISRSSDYGASFSADVLASGTAGEVCDCCPAAIISAGTETIMLYRNNLSNIRDIWAGISGDGGLTFPGTMPVDSSHWMVSSCPSSGPDGFVLGDSLYSVFMSQGTGSSLVYLSRASLAAATSKTNAITGVFTGLTGQNYPRIANADYSAAVVWVQNATSGKSIVYSFTDNISKGFTNTATVTGATGSGIANADIAMSPGAIHIVWENDNTGKVMYVKGTYPTSAISTNVFSGQAMEIFPNPAKDNFTVRLTNIPGIASCYLSDINGRHITLTPTGNSIEAVFSLKGIAKGSFYFVMYDNGGKGHHAKLVVQ